MFQKIAITILLSCWCFASAFGQLRSTERAALKNLSRHRWVKAKLLIEKGMQKDSVNAGIRYFYAHYFLSRNNPAYHTDSANLYLNQARMLYERSDDREKERLNRGGIDSLALTSLRLRIDSAAFANARLIDTEGAFLHFLSMYKNAVQTSEAAVLRDEAAYRDAVKLNTYESFLTFLGKYPSSSRATDARSKYERLLFEARTKDGRLESYQSFLNEFPATPYRRIVENNIFEIITARGDRQALETFIAQYPYSVMTGKACNILFHISEPDVVMPASCHTDSLMNASAGRHGYLVPILQQHRYGFMNQAGQIVIAPAYDSLQHEYRCGNISTDVIIADGTLISKTGERILSEKVIGFEELGSGLLLVESDSCDIVLHKSGFRLGECVEDAKVLNGKFVGLKRNGKWALFSLAGRALTLFEWDEIQVHGDILIFRDGDNFRLLSTFNISVAAENRPVKLLGPFSEVKPWSSHGLWAKSAEFEGVFDRELQPVIAFDNHNLKPVFFGATASTASGYQLLDSLGTEMVSARDVLIREPWVVLKQDQKSRFFNLAKRQVAAGVYDSVNFAGPFAIAYRPDSIVINFTENVSRTFARNARPVFIPGKDSIAFLQVTDKKKAIYDHDGERLFVSDFDQIQYAGSGYFIFSRNDKKGLLGMDGKVVLPAEYDAIGSVSGNVMSLLKNMKFGLFSLSKKKAIKPQFEKNITVYNQRWMVAWQKGYFAFLDGEAKPVSKFEFDEVQFWNDSTALVKRKSDWFVYDILQKKNIESGIKQIRLISDSPDEKLCIVKQGDFFGVMSNRKGFVIPATFTNLINVGSAEEPLYFTEKHVEEALLFVVIYYNHHGKLLYRQVYEEHDYDKIRCEEE